MEGVELSEPRHTEDRMDASFEIALRSPGIRALGFDLLGILEHDPQDRLADLGFLREPAPTEGPA